MAEKKNSTITLLVTGAVLVILVAALISSIASEALDKTSKNTISSETKATSEASACPAGAINESYTYTIANPPTGWKVNDCPVTNFRITNSSGSAFTETTDYAFTAAAGTYTLVNTALVNRTCAKDNVTYISYDYCADDYLNSSWGRSLLNIVPGFIAIALLIAIVYVAYTILGREKED